MSTTPAGWYDDGSGRQRWWDGQQWTEHFAPEAASATEAESAPESSVAANAAERSPAIETPTDAPAAGEAPSYDAPEAPSTDDTVFRASAEAPTAATTPLGDDVPAYSAPATPNQPASSYPGTAPAYPGADAQPAYPAAGPYLQTEPEAPKKLSVLGLVGLGLSAVGTILAFIPLIGFIGFILLGAGFIVSLISLFLKGKKWPGIAGLILSVVGGIISAVMFFVFFFAIAQNASDELNNLPSSSPSIEATEPGETDGADDGTRPTSAEVAVGLTAILASEGTEGYTEPQITCLSDLLVESDLDNSTLRAIAESDGTLTDVDAAYGFAEVLGDTEAISACFVP
ncbi:DUF2510 domain-containing protein [Microbacterium sp. NPDC055988]|uniref:DUF2510 domain-containing protein n=1 Tax=Microbacterium sp. NPDC055988 TaxID=3345671 RepID=UPI0035E1475F